MDNLGIITYISPLKVGSCPYDDNVVQIYFLSFLCSIQIILFLSLFLPRKPQDFAENLRFFVCLFPLCLNSVLKIV